MVPKVFEPLKFDCTRKILSYKKRPHFGMVSLSREVTKVVTVCKTKQIYGSVPVLFIHVYKRLSFNPIALRMAKTLLSFGHSECNRAKLAGWRQWAITQIFI